MKRFVMAIIAVALLPALPAGAAELEELLEESAQASYSAEQLISCSTPDGARDALVRIVQDGDQIKVTSAADSEAEVTAGAGGWSLTRGGGLVAEASVGSDMQGFTEPMYEITDDGDVLFLGREATAFQLMREDSLRAELVFDGETGAMLQAITFEADGTVYCERRFVSFDDEVVEIEMESLEAKEEPITPAELAVDLPESVAGFERLDTYSDDDGLVFAYYSDGFFSFALFQTDAPVELPDPVVVDLASGRYTRSFTAGQVTFSWETVDKGMALVGDLPPDLHPQVLSEMPHPEDPGLFRRWWRALFG